MQVGAGAIDGHEQLPRVHRKGVPCGMRPRIITVARQCHARPQSPARTHARSSSHACACVCAKAGCRPTPFVCACVRHGCGMVRPLVTTPRPCDAHTICARGRAGRHTGGHICTGTGAWLCSHAKARACWASTRIPSQSRAWRHAVPAVAFMRSCRLAMHARRIRTPICMIMIY